MSVTHAQARLRQLMNHQNLSFDQSFEVIKSLMSAELPDALSGALLTALSMKGETSDEVGGAAKAMRGQSLHIDLSDLVHVVDIVGTGGDGQSIFNVSTASSFVAAAAGAAILKLELPSFPAAGCASRIASSRASEYAPADAPSAA